MNLTTQAKVAAIVQGDISLSVDALALIDYFIPAVSGRAKQFCGRQFKRESRTEYYDGGAKFIFLNEPPIQSITSINYSTTWEWATANLVPATNYALLNAANGMVGYKSGLWYPGERAYKVVYVGGYDAYSASPPQDYVAIPSELEEAIAMQVAYEFRRKNDPGLSSVTYPDGSVAKMETGGFLDKV